MLRVGIAATGHDRRVGEPPAPLEVQQGQDVGIELGADQPVLGRRDDVQIGHLDRQPPAFVIVDRGHQEAGTALDGRVRHSKGRQPEDRNAADAKQGVAEQDGAQFLVLNHLFGLDGDRGGLGVPLGVADRAGGEEGVVQLVDIGRAAYGGRGHQAGAVRQPGREIDGDPGVEVGIELQMAGVDDVAFGAGQLDPLVGRARTGGHVVGDAAGAQGVGLETGQDAFAVADRRNDVTLAGRGAGLDIDRAGRQAIGAGLVRGGRVGGRGLGLGRRCESERQAGEQGRAGQEPCARPLPLGGAAVTLLQDRFPLVRRQAPAWRVA